MTGLTILFLVTLGATLVGTLLALEAQAWAPYVSRRLVRKALAEMPAELPESLRARWEEELEADLAAFVDRPLGGLVFAVRLRRRGGRELAAELSLERALGEAAARAGSGGDSSPPGSDSEEQGGEEHAYEYRHVTYRIGPLPQKTYVVRHRVRKKGDEG